MSTKGKRIRLSLDVSPEFYDVIQKLAEQNGSTKSEVMRKAIALFEYVSEAKTQGGKIAILPADTSEKNYTEVVGI